MEVETRLIQDESQLNTEEFQKLLFQDFEMWARNFATFKGIDGKPQPCLLPNKLQKRVIEHYRKCQIEGKPCLIMILKPRQKGASTIAEAIAYHHMRRHKDLNGVLMGDVQSTSDKVFEMYRRYAEGDLFPYDGPETAGQNFAPDGNLADEITLASKSKWWKETAGSTNAGRSGTVQALHLDEVAHYPKSESKDPTTAVLGSFNDELPTSLGFATSTANGCTGWFYDTWWGKNNWFKVFAAWYEFEQCRRPFESDDQRFHFERTMTKDEVLEQKLYGVDAEQLHWRRGIIQTKYQGDIGKFRQEHPSSPEGAFLSSSRMRFDEEALANMEAFAKANDYRQCGNVIQQGRRGMAQWLPDDRGSVIRWEEPRFGCRYLVSIDTCTGRDQQIGGTTADPDSHSAQVWRAGYTDKNGTWVRPAVVMLHHSREDIDILAEIVAAMSAYYGNCITFPEVNNCGLALVKALERLGVPMFRRRPHATRAKVESEDERLEAFGWQTDKLTKKLVIDTLAPAIRQQDFIVYGPEILLEYKSFIITDTGEAKAAPGKHDDHVMASAIGFYNLGAATEYRLGRMEAMDHRRLANDPRYMSPDGFTRKAATPRR
jgi:hypothetical protein